MLFKTSIVHPKIDATKTLWLYSQQAPFVSKLYIILRYDKLIKINNENQHIMRRLQSAKSVYNAKNWEKQYKVNNRRVRMLSANSGHYSNHPYFTPSAKFRDPVRASSRKNQYLSEKKSRNKQKLFVQSSAGESKLVDLQKIGKYYWSIFTEVVAQSTAKQRFT